MSGTYTVRFSQSVDGGQSSANHDHVVSWRVPEPRLEAMVALLRFNGCESFSVERQEAPQEQIPRPETPSPMTTQS